MVTNYICNSFNAAPMRSGVYLVGYLRPLPNRTRPSIFQIYQTSSFSSSTFHLSKSRPEPSGSAKPPISGSNRLRPTSSLTSSSSSSPSSSAVDTVNPPTSTLPPPLYLPEKPENAGLSYYFTLGRAYYSFYKTGVKNVWHNYQAARPILRRLGMREFIIRKFPDVSAGPRPRPGVPVNNLLGGQMVMFDEEAIAKRKDDQQELVGSMNRREFQMLRRRASDTAKMLPFLLVLMIFGELTPFVVGFGVVKPPLTCSLPKQIESARMKSVEWKTNGLSELDRNGVKRALSNMVGVPANFERVLEKATAEDVIVMAEVMNVGPRLVRKLPYRHHFTLRKVRGDLLRLAMNNHLSYLAIDDALIAKAGGVKSMSVEEVKLAVDERGGVEVGMGLSRDQAETDLRWWLQKWVSASNK